MTKKTTFVLMVIILSVFLYVLTVVGKTVFSKTGVVAQSAIFEWIQKPAAIHFVKRFDRTYIAWVTSDGKIQIRYFDNANNGFSPIYTVDDLYPHFKIEAKDDHNAPSLLILPDGRILVFYVVHDVNNAFFMKESQHAEDISSWTDRKNMQDPSTQEPYNYPQAKILDNGEIAVFYRVGNYYDSREYFKVSKDNGISWSKATKLIDFGEKGIYAFVTSRGNQIHIAWSKAQTGSVPKSNVYYLYSPDAGITWLSRNNKRQVLPIDEKAADIVFNSTDKPAFVWDIVVDSFYNPYIVYSYQNDPHHEYDFSRWNGKEWVTNKITNSKELYDSNNFFSGGIVIDPQNVYNVYLSKQRVHLELEKWVSKDLGKSWDMDKKITENSEEDNFRPQVVENYSPNLSLVWSRGIYEGLVRGHWSGFQQVSIYSNAAR